MMFAYIGRASCVLVSIVGSASSVVQGALHETTCNARREHLRVKPVAMLQRTAHYSAPLKPNATPSMSDSNQSFPKKATVLVAEVRDGSGTIGNVTNQNIASMLQLKNTRKVKTRHASWTQAGVVASSGSSRRKSHEARGKRGTAKTSPGVTFAKFHEKAPSKQHKKKANGNSFFSWGNFNKACAYLTFFWLVGLTYAAYELHSAKEHGRRSTNGVVNVASIDAKQDAPAVATKTECTPAKEIDVESETSRREDTLKVIVVKRDEESTSSPATNFSKSAPQDAKKNQVEEESDDDEDDDDDDQVESSTETGGSCTNFDREKTKDEGKEENKDRAYHGEEQKEKAKQSILNKLKALNSEGNGEIRKAELLGVLEDPEAVAVLEDLKVDALKEELEAASAKVGSVPHSASTHRLC